MDYKASPCNPFFYHIYFMRCYIKNGANSTYYYKDILRNNDFVFNPRYNRWQKDCSSSEGKKYARFCRRRGLNFTIEDPKYTRSTDYRQSFFKERPYDRGRKYRCVYCGKLLKKSQVEVDHVIPVDKAANYNKYKRLLRLSGCKTINDVKNLSASCRKCNRRKSNKAGYWIIRGFLGRSFLYWTIKRTFIGLFYTIILIIIGVSIYYYV